MTTRLFIGEGNFSYTEAFLNKHPRAQIIATDLHPHPVDLPRAEALQGRGVAVLNRIDGTQLEAHFPGAKFARIHWNCPHDGSPFQTQTLPPIIAAFFQSCRNMQNPGDQVHITLAQPPGKVHFYQGYIYNIVAAAERAGYKIFKKRRFDAARYPEYSHVQTKINVKAAVTDSGLREFVFKQAADASKPHRIHTERYYTILRSSFECATDDDSSSGE